MKSSQSLTLSLALALVFLPSPAEAKPWEKEWLTEKWTANETPFYTARQQVIARFKATPATQLKSLYERYRSQGESSPQDVMAQYRQAVAFYQYRARTGKADATTLKERMSDLAPHSYSYARMRYLLTASRNDYGLDLFPLGRRLLARDPNDYQVLYWQTVICDTTKPDQRQEGLAHANKILKMSPQQWQSYELMGDYYRKIWVGKNIGGKDSRALNKAPEYRDKSIVWFKKTLAMMTPDNPKRKGIEHSIWALEHNSMFYWGPDRKK